MKIIFVVIILVSNILSAKILLSQTTQIDKQIQKSSFYFELYLGTQVSGIRKEDYVASNYSPYIQLSIGKTISQHIALTVNYQGPYFYFIGDNFKHKYFYFGGDAIINLNNFISTFKKRFLNIYVFTGTGLLFNGFYNKTNLCINTGIINELKINREYSIKFKLSSIIGHGIYQKDRDILPNISLGLSKNF